MYWTLSLSRIDTIDTKQHQGNTQDLWNTPYPYCNWQNAAKAVEPESAKFSTSAAHTAADVLQFMLNVNPILYAGSLEK